MQTRLVIMQELIARRKALRSEEIEVCPAKGSGQQARALRGSRGERQQIELTGERPRWYQTPRRVHSSVARRCREDSGGERLSTSRAAATAHTGAAGDHTCRHPAVRCHECWTQRSRPCDCTVGAKVSSLLAAASLSGLRAPGRQRSRRCPRPSSRRALRPRGRSAAGPRASTGGPTRGAAGRRRTGAG